MFCDICLDTEGEEVKATHILREKDSWSHKLCKECLGHLSAQLEIDDVSFTTEEVESNG